MEPNETPFEAAQHRVDEAEKRVNAQATRVAELARWGQDTTQAQATLAVFQATLQFMQEDLLREQERAADKRP